MGVGDIKESLVKEWMQADTAGAYQYRAGCGDFFSLFNEGELP